MRVEEFKQYQKSGLKEFQKKVSDSSQHQFAKKEQSNAYAKPTSQLVMVVYLNTIGSNHVFLSFKSNIGFHGCDRSTFESVVRKNTINLCE